MPPTKTTRRARTNGSTAAAPGISSFVPPAAGSAGSSPVLQQPLLQFLIKLGTDQGFRAKFQATPETALNDLADLTPAERQLILTQNASDLLDAIKGGAPLQHTQAAVPAIDAGDAAVNSTSPGSGTPSPATVITHGGTSGPNGGRRRVIRVQVEFDE